MTDELKGAVLIKKRGPVMWKVHNLFTGLRERNAYRLRDASLPNWLIVRLCKDATLYKWHARYTVAYGDWRLTPDD